MSPRNIIMAHIEDEVWKHWTIFGRSLKTYFFFCSFSTLHQSPNPFLANLTQAFARENDPDKIIRVSQTQNQYKGKPCGYWCILLSKYIASGDSENFEKLLIKSKPESEFLAELAEIMLCP